MQVPVRFRFIHPAITAAVVVVAASLGRGGEDLVPDPASVPTKPRVMPTRVHCRQVLIGWKGLRSSPHAARSKAEARKLAEEVLERARSKGQDFLELVKEYSDDPLTKGRGGLTPIMRPGDAKRDNLAPIEDAVFHMEVGQISGVVETHLGFHIFQRIEIVEFAAAHILVSYQGSELRRKITRTREEAKARAEKALEKAKGMGLDFGRLVVEYSDVPGRYRGGSIGVVGPSRLLPALEKVILDTPVGAVSGIVETPLGFHIVKRLPVWEVRQILIRYRGASGAGPSVERSKDEALALAEKLAKDLKKPGADFASLARKHSEDARGRLLGGDMGSTTLGVMSEPIEKALEKLPVGEVSNPVESPSGFHILERYR